MSRDKGLLRIYKKTLLILGTLFLVWAPTAWLWAAEHGGEAAAHDGGAATKDLIARCINFGLMVIILFVVIRKSSMKDFFSSRRESIREKLDELKRGKELAENRVKELEQKLKAFEEEKKRILEQFKAEGIAEKERIIKEAKERAKQILEQAEFTIQREMDAARGRLRQEVAELATKKAEEMISKEITDKDQEHLVSEFIDRVEKLH
ncbi:MAG: ATP synthase F0 subunit B [Deltaproteobacteria bacterium]|nr:ATP synthase F0 subunit B [Deltaproteobacteria bacterium]MBW2083595.1 ATP synthase F0 subunit B [Deltaproteobacteria bacterium]HDM10199.1 ATP synthase F0 subunit B [Desulfobacteraceae bacterium]